MIEKYWKLLEENRVKTSVRRIEDLFEKDETRFKRFSLVTDDFTLDYSKTNIDDYAMANLLNLAEYASVKEKTEDMFSGKKINNTENRSVLHTLLRNFKSPLVVDGLDISLKVNQSLDKALRFSENIRSGKIVSATGERFQNIINILFSYFWFAYRYQLFSTYFNFVTKIFIKFFFIFFFKIRPLFYLYHFTRG